MARASYSVGRVPVTKVTNVKELWISGFKPIFHELRGNTIKDWPIKVNVPNSFDRLGSLKGEYNIKIDSWVPPIQQADKVPIEIKYAIKAQLDYMLEEDIIKPQMEPTPWVNSATYPVKTNWRG